MKNVLLIYMNLCRRKIFITRCLLQSQIMSSLNNLFSCLILDSFKVIFLFKFWYSIIIMSYLYLYLFCVQFTFEQGFMHFGKVKVIKKQLEIHKLTSCGNIWTQKLTLAMISINMLVVTGRL